MLNDLPQLLVLQLEYARINIQQPYIRKSAASLFYLGTTCEYLPEQWGLICQLSIFSLGVADIKDISFTAQTDDGTRINMLAKAICLKTGFAILAPTLAEDQKYFKSKALHFPNSFSVQDDQAIIFYEKNLASLKTIMTRSFSKNFTFNSHFKFSATSLPVEDKTNTYNGPVFLEDGTLIGYQSAKKIISSLHIKYLLNRLKQASDQESVSNLLLVNYPLIDLSHISLTNQTASIYNKNKQEDDTIFGSLVQDCAEHYPFKPLDVIIEVGGYPIKNGHFLHPEFGLTNLSAIPFVLELDNRIEFTATIFRQNTKETLALTSNDFLLPTRKKNHPFKWVIYQGLVVQSYSRFHDAHMKSTHLQQKSKSYLKGDHEAEIVMITSGLIPSTLYTNTGIPFTIPDKSQAIVTKVDGERVKSLKHFLQLMAESKSNTPLLEILCPTTTNCFIKKLSLEEHQQLLIKNDISEISNVDFDLIYSSSAQLDSLELKDFQFSRKIEKRKFKTATEVMLNPQDFTHSILFINVNATHPIPIRPYIKKNPSPALGSGVVFKYNDEIFVGTCAHLINFSTKNITIDVAFPAEPTLKFSATPILVDSRNDVALLRISEKDLQKFLEVASPLKLKEKLPQQGDPLWIIGFPGGSIGMSTTPKMGKGSVVTVGYNAQQKLQYQTDAPANRGNSGGPALDRSGDVLGLLIASNVGQQLQNFIVPSIFLLKAANELIKHQMQHPEKALNYQRIRAVPFTYVAINHPEIKESMGLTRYTNKGVLITNVYRADIPLKARDILLEIALNDCFYEVNSEGSILYENHLIHHLLLFDLCEQNDIFSCKISRANIESIFSFPFNPEWKNNKMHVFLNDKSEPNYLIFDNKLLIAEYNHYIYESFKKADGSAHSLFLTHSYQKTRTEQRDTKLAIIEVAPGVTELTPWRTYFNREASDTTGLTFLNKVNDITVKNFEHLKQLLSQQGQDFTFHCKDSQTGNKIVFTIIAGQDEALRIAQTFKKS